MAHVHIRTGDSTKKNVQKILKTLGIDMSSAVNLYFEQIVLTKGIPFVINIPTSSCNHPICTGSHDVPDHIMQEWEQESDEALSKGKSYNSVDDMFEDILSEKDDE